MIINWQTVNGDNVEVAEAVQFSRNLAIGFICEKEYADWKMVSIEDVAIKPGWKKMTVQHSGGSLFSTVYEYMDDWPWDEDVQFVQFDRLREHEVRALEEANPIDKARVIVRLTRSAALEIIEQGHWDGWTLKSNYLISTEIWQATYRVVIADQEGNEFSSVYTSSDHELSNHHPWEAQSHAVFHRVPKGSDVFKEIAPPQRAVEAPQPSDPALFGLKRIQGLVSDVKSRDASRPSTQELIRSLHLEALVLIASGSPYYVEIAQATLEAVPGS